MSVFKTAITGFLCLMSISLLAQNTTLKGKVKDAESGEVLIGATIYDTLSESGTFTNDFGYFQLSLPDDSAGVLRISHLGYEMFVLEYSTADTKKMLSVELIPLNLNEVVVQAERLVAIKSGSAITISHPSELTLPTLKPEIDILDIIKNQPGVQQTLEGSTGFSVRGGNPDQNLVVMDGIPVYNGGHFGGFVSIFDPFAISKLTFYKGGFPARFGGRASSILDVHLKQGDMNAYHGEFVIGPLFSKFSLEGPIKKGKSSFLVSFRKSNVDLVLGSLYLINKPEERYGLKFHDLTVKLNHQFSEKSNLYFSFYQGRDRIWEKLDRDYFSGDQPANFSFSRINSWGNLFANLRWGKVIGNKLHLNTSVALSSYNYDYSQEDHSTREGSTDMRNINNYGVAVKDYLIKSELEYYLKKNVQVDVGGQLIFHDFTPVDTYRYQLDQSGFGATERQENVNLNAFEAFGYAQASIHNKKRNLHFRPGLRFGVYAINDNNFFSLQPRLMLTYQVREDIGMELDYSKSFQPVHSLNSSGTSLEPDIWIPATRKLAPVESHTVSFSVTKNHKNWSASGGLFYRRLENLIEINRKNGLSIATTEWEESILEGGKGSAYGLEIAGNRRFERLLASANYTFSRSFRKFDLINNGEKFPFIFDRPHAFNLEGSYKISSRSSLSLIGTIQSGQPFTLTNKSNFLITNAYFSNVAGADIANNYDLNTPFPVFFQETLVTENINALRMPIYHRIDLAYSNKKRWKNGFLREWNVSVYNVMNRKNPYFIYLNANSNGFEQFTLMPILPSISYKLKF